MTCGRGKHDAVAGHRGENWARDGRVEVRSSWPLREPAAHDAGVRILLKGPPRVGKSTVARDLVSLLEPRGVSVGGFLTRELREGGQRVGFVIETLDGQRGVLARVGSHGARRVGRYGVDLEVLERLALPALLTEASVTVIDELGAMQLASEPFRHAVEALFETGRRGIVATVHVHADPLTDALKARSDVQVLEVTAANRGDRPLHVVRLLDAAGALGGEA